MTTKDRIMTNTGWIGARLGARTSRAAVAALALVFAAATGGCDGFLDVDNESDILDQDLNTPDAMGPVVNGVAGDFGEVYSQGAHNVGLAALELWHTGSHGDDRETDEGFLKRPSSQGNGGYNDASRAYWVSQDAQRRLNEAFPDDAESRAEMAEVIVWGGYTLHFLADNFCSATFNAGPEVTPDEVRAMAEADFTRAITVATAAGSSLWRLRAIAGRARARLFLGDAAGAIADARQIPDDFTFYFNYSNNSGREQNHFPGHTRDKYRREVGIHPRIFEDPVLSADPRVPMKDWGEDAVGPDAIRRWVEQEKYPEYETDMLVSSWQEVRLIEAEAEIRLGNLSRAVALINQVRAAADLAPYTGAQTETAVTDQLRYERSAELWLQGQTLFDLRRFNDPILDVPPGRGGGTVRDKCWEIGEREYQTNPNLGG
jgi:hypothetical protein